MSTIAVEPEIALPARRSPVFGGRTRWIAAGLLVTGSLLQVVEFLLEPTSNGTSAERVAYWIDHPTRIGLSMAVGLVAVAFLLGNVAVLVNITKQTSRRVAWAAAALMTAAMTGLAALHGLEMMAYWIAKAGHGSAAVAALDTTDVGIPGAALFLMFLGGALFGTIALGVALWRSPFVPRIAVVLLAAFVGLDIIAGQPVTGHLAALGSSLVVATAVVTGYVRAPRKAAAH